MSAHLIYHSSAARSRCFRHFFIPIAPQGGRRGSKENRRRRPGPHPSRPPPRAPRPLRRRKAQHLSRRWTFPPFCTTMIFAREDIPPPRTHAPVAQLDRVSDCVPSQTQGGLCSTPQTVVGCSRMRLRLLFASQRSGRSPRSSFFHCVSKLSRCSLIFAPRGRLSPLFIKSGIVDSRGGSFCSLGQESYRSLTRFARRLLFSPRHIPLIHGTATNSPAHLLFSPLSPAIPSSLRFVLTTPAGCTKRQQLSLLSFFYSVTSLVERRNSCCRAAQVLPSEMEPNR